MKCVFATKNPLTNTNRGRQTPQGSPLCTYREIQSATVQRLDFSVSYLTEDLIASFVEHEKQIYLQCK